MAKFKVQGSLNVNLEATIEASSLEEAEAIMEKVVFAQYDPHENRRGHQYPYTVGPWLADPKDEDANGGAYAHRRIDWGEFGTDTWLADINIEEE